MMIDAEVRKQAKAMIEAGYPRSFIAESLGISDGTVKNIKKEMKAGIKNAPDAVAERQPGQDESVSDDFDFSTILTQKERKYTSEIQDQIALYEDPVEGWVYHLTAERLKHQKSSMWWNVITYPESCPEKEYDLFDAFCQGNGWQAAIGPLHDKDVWSHDNDPQVRNGVKYGKGELYKAGDPKKFHRHVLVKVPVKISFEEFCDIIRPRFRCPYPQKCFSLSASFDYLIHLHETDKYHYEASEIRRINHFVVEPNEHEKKIMLSEISARVKDDQVMNFADLVDLYRNQPEYQALIAVRANYFIALTKGVWLKHGMRRSAQG